jgi:hypothetical protein
VNWDLSKADVWPTSSRASPPSGRRRGQRRQALDLQAAQGVKFHDGTDFRCRTS